MEGGTNVHRHRMRCSKFGCFRRFTLKQHFNKYKKSVICPHCGCNIVHSREKERRSEMNRKIMCFCLPFKHKKGEILGCIYHPKEKLTKEDEQQIEGMLETLRGG